VGNDEGGDLSVKRLSNYLQYYDLKYYDLKYYDLKGVM
jgi:hypothetical protein